MNTDATTKELCIVIAAGGTGGHVFPAVAVAEAVRHNAPSARCVFVGTKGKIETTVVPQYGFEIETVWLSGLRRGSIAANALLPLKVVVAIAQARAILRAVRPRAVVCAGGYVGYPVGVAAFRTRVPLVLMESNVTPGMVVRRLSRRASSIHVAFESSRRYFGANAPLHVSGNPVRAVFAASAATSKARADFGLDPDKRTLLVFGGSLGARTINQAVEGVLDALLGSGMQILWQTGAQWDRKAQRNGVVQMRFIERMREAYAAADLAVCRAGATTIAELTYLGVPSVLVPYPHAADDHQTANARALAEDGAAVMIRDDELGDTFLPVVTRLMADDLRRAAMKDAAWALGVRDAAERIAEDILAVARNDA